MAIRPDTASATGEAPGSDDQTAWAAWARDAADRGQWETAQRRWDDCLAKFGARADWLGQKGNALRQLGRIDEAEALFEALARDHPDLSVGLAGLAWTAHHKGEIERALSLLTRCAETYPHKAPVVWTQMRASLSMRLGRSAQAEALYRTLIEQEPENRLYRSAMVWAAIADCRNGDDSRERRARLAKYVWRRILPGADATGRISALRLLNSMGAWEEAARLLSRMAPRARTLEELETCFAFIPQHVERGSRGALWDGMLRRVRRIADEPGRPDRVRALDLELRLLLALERFADFVAKFDAACADIDGSEHLFALRRVRDRLSKPRGEVFAEAKVFGIGLFRTGTTSLTGALAALGFDTAHWTNPLTHQLIGEIDIFMFGACTDSTVSQDFEKLYYLYPNARFVLTRRPIEDWVRSVENHHRRHSWARDLEALRITYGESHIPHRFAQAAVEFGLYLNAGDLAEAYRAFDRRVVHFFSDKPGGKLLRLDVFAGQGWPELCRFLGRPEPDAAFPRLNTALD